MTHRTTQDRVHSTVGAPRGTLWGTVNAEKSPPRSLPSPCFRFIFGVSGIESERRDEHGGHRDGSTDIDRVDRGYLESHDGVHAGVSRLRQLLCRSAVAAAVEQDLHPSHAGREHRRQAPRPPSP